MTSTPTEPQRSVLLLSAFEGFVVLLHRLQETVAELLSCLQPLLVGVTDVYMQSLKRLRLRSGFYIPRPFTAQEDLGSRLLADVG